MQREFLDKSGSSSNAFLTVSPNIDKDHTRSLRQLSWRWRLKFWQLAASLALLTNSFVHILRTANCRIVSPDSPTNTSSSRLYKIIELFLVLVIRLLCVELVAYFKGWHFSPPPAESAEAMVERAYAKWLEIRADYLAPPLQGLTNVCVIVLFMIQSVDRVVLVLGCFWIKLRELKPIAEHRTFLWTKLFTEFL